MSAVDTGTLGPRNGSATTDSMAKIRVVETTASEGVAIPSFSLELLTKKRDILSSEVAKLDECLRQRTQLMCKLRQTLEALLTSNGDLEECVRLRESKLQSLRVAMATTAEAINARDTSQSSVDLGSGSEKRRLCEAFLLSFDEQRAKHEIACMKSEEELQRHVEAWKEAREKLTLAHEQAGMNFEDARSTAKALQLEQTSTRTAEEKMISSSHSLETLRLSVSDMRARLKEMNAQLADHRISLDSGNEMLAEDLQSLRERKRKAESDVHHVEGLMRKAGAALPEDFELEESARLLSEKVDLLTVNISEARFSRRDAVLRRKEEVDMLSIAKSNVASREEQLQWLEKQLNHLKKEHRGMVSARTAEEEAYNLFKVAHDEQMDSIAQYLASISDETMKALEQIALEHANISSGRSNLAARSASLLSIKEIQAKKAAQVEIIQVENRKTQGDISRSMELLNKLDATQAAIRQSVSGSQMLCEDELAAQQRCVEELDTVKRDIQALEGLLLKVTDTFKGKLADIGSDFTFGNISDCHIKNLVDAVERKANEKMQKEASAFTCKRKEIETRIHALEVRHDEMMVSIQTRYATALDLKVQEHEILLEKLNSKNIVAKAHQASPMIEGSNLSGVVAENKPRGSHQRAHGDSCRSSRKKKTIATLQESRPHSNSTNRQKDENLPPEDQDLKVTPTEATGSHSARMQTARLDRAQHVLTSSPPNAPRHRAKTRGGAKKGEEPLPLMDLRSQEHSSPLADAEPQNPLQPEWRHHLRVNSQASTKAVNVSKLSKKPRTTQLNRMHVLRAAADATEDSQQAQSQLDEGNGCGNLKLNSIHRTMPISTVPKPPTKTPRGPNFPKPKARKASQSVDWLADESFSFS